MIGKPAFATTWSQVNDERERCERQARSDAPSVHTEERVDLLCPKNSQLGSKHCCVPSQKGEDAQLCNGVPRSLLEHLDSCFWF